MKCIFKRQATSANTPIKLEFDVAGIEYLVKDFTQGDIYVALEETSDKNVVYCFGRMCTSNYCQSRYELSSNDERNYDNYSRRDR